MLYIIALGHHFKMTLSGPGDFVIRVCCDIFCKWDIQKIVENGLLCFAVVTFKSTILWWQKYWLIASWACLCLLATLFKINLPLLSNFIQRLAKNLMRCVAEQQQETSAVGILEKFSAEKKYCKRKHQFNNNNKLDLWIKRFTFYNTTRSLEHVPEETSIVPPYMLYCKICHHIMPGWVSREMESVTCLIIQHAIQVLMSLEGEKAALSLFPSLILHQNRHERRMQALKRSRK